MPSKVKVTKEKRLGARAESVIKSKLEFFSTVNPFQTDLGIDFYCELIENGSPSIPFFVQAKGTQHFDENWGQSIKKSTIMYWLQQMFPVFLVVYDEDTGNCHWMSIEDRRRSLIKKYFQTKSETIYIKMDKLHTLEEGREKNAEFIRKIKDDLNSIRQFHGYPQPKGDGYVKEIPSPPRSRGELLRIKENVRQGMYSFIHYYSLLNDLENIYLCCEFLTKFDKSHYNHFVWFGKINKALGNNEQAKRGFEEALRICERDKKWPRESMETIIAYIKKEIESCK